MAKNFNGPTQLNIPRDYLYGVCEDDIYPTPSIRRGPGDMDALEQAAQLVSSAEFPVIVAGGGVSQADALKEVMTLAEHLTAPVVNSYLHNDSFPAFHPLSVGPIGYCGSKAAMRTITKAEVVLALGCRQGPFGTLPQYDMAYWPDNASIIQVDVDVAVLGLSKRLDVASCGEAGSFSEALLKRLETMAPDRPKDDNRLQEIADANQAWAEKKNQIDYYDSRFVGANLRENPDYAKLAEDMCAKGYKVTDYKDVGDVVIDAVASGRPCVINAMIQGGEEVMAEPFRRDALKMPVRYLEKYKHLSG